jgi:diamine N-acetyltransferase
MMSEEPPNVTRDSTISLREVTAETAREIMRLEVNDAQKHFVAPNSVSIAQAYFEPKAWFRAIYADDTPGGLPDALRRPR